LYESKAGYAWDVSLAVDAGDENAGLLIGIKYFYTHNTLETSNAEQVSSMAGIFFKGAFRKKRL
jgi:hypothetical protein